MRIYDNGVYRNMTPEEVAEMERMVAEMPQPESAPEERIAQLERDNADLKEALEMLLSGEVNADG